MHYGGPWSRVAAVGAAILIGSMPARGQGAGTVAPDIVSITCRFDAPQLTPRATGYSMIAVGGCETQAQPGWPRLPFRIVRLLLPPRSGVAGVTAIPASEPIILPGNWRLDFGREPLPLGGVAVTSVVAPDAPDATVYASKAGIPASRAELLSVQRQAGYNIAIVRVFPVVYTPATGRLTFADELTLDVALSSEPGSLIPPSVHVEERGWVAAFVDNPDELSVYDRIPKRALGDSTPHYLLITRAALLNAFQPLIERKEAAGLTVRIEVMESITNLYAGVDDAERLRNCIRQAYTNWGVQYVLLGGDTEAVPCRGAYARCAGVTRTSMPSDLYFACLDGSWNRDGGDVDLLAEVCVGRAPVETLTEVSNFVARCLAAEEAPVGQFRACLAGEFLNASGAQGGNALDTLLPAFDNSLCPVTWLDDRPLASAAWTALDALAALNRSPLLVAHFGHGTDYGESTMAMRLTVPDLDSLANASPFLLYSTACNTGAFDNNPAFGEPDCIAEELVKRNRHGAFAVVANSREGWYDSGTEAHYSGEFQRRFFERLLPNEATTVGIANTFAQQDLLGSVETTGASMPYRWCYFGITLFGDPHQTVHVPLALRFRADSNKSVVKWNSWSNRTYRVFRTTDLTSGPGECIASNVVATLPLNVCTDSAPNLLRAFYRVQAQ